MVSDGLFHPLDLCRRSLCSALDAINQHPVSGEATGPVAEVFAGERRAIAARVALVDEAVSALSAVIVTAMTETGVSSVRGDGRSNHTSHCLTKTAFSNLFTSLAVIRSQSWPQLQSQPRRRHRRPRRRRSLRRKLCLVSQLCPRSRSLARSQCFPVRRSRAL